MTVSEARKSLPPFVHQESTWDDAAIKKIYGKHVHKLTASLAKKVVGKNLAVLTGQAIYSPETDSERKKFIERGKVLGFSADGYDDDIPNSQLRKTMKKYDDIAFQTDFKFGVYECGAGKYTKYGTGSGCDPIFVFLK